MPPFLNISDDEEEEEEEGEEQEKEEEKEAWLFVRPSCRSYRAEL